MFSFSALTYILLYPLLSFRLTYGFDFFMRLISTPLSRHKFRNCTFRGQSSVSSQLWFHEVCMDCVEIP